MPANYVEYCYAVSATFQTDSYGSISSKKSNTACAIPYTSGALLIRGYERGERVYNSMLSRGFRGTLELKEREFISSNIILFIAIFSITISVLDQFIL